MTRKKIGPVNEPAKGSWPVIGTRIHPDDLRQVDVACAHLGEKRSEMMLRVLLAEKDRVLANVGSVNAPRKGERRRGDRRDEPPFVPSEGEAAAA
jgi:hypothetical protein